MCVNRHALHCYCLHLTWKICPVTKNRQYFFIALPLSANQQVYPYNGRGFLWIQNTFKDNLNFSTTKIAAVLISMHKA